MIIRSRLVRQNQCTISDACPDAKDLCHHGDEADRKRLGRKAKSVDDTDPRDCLHLVEDIPILTDGCWREDLADNKDEEDKQ